VAVGVPSGTTLLWVALSLEKALTTEDTEETLCRLAPQSWSATGKALTTKDTKEE